MFGRATVYLQFTVLPFFCIYCGQVYCETEDNDISNGLLLRADIHTLFDLNLIAIEPETYKICLAPSLQDSSYYNDIKDKSLELPNPKYLPNKDALEWRWKYFESKSEIG